MLSQRHVGAPLYHYTSQVGPKFGNSGSLQEWTWSHYFIFEAYIHLRQLHISILDIQSVCVIGMLSHGHLGAPICLYTSQVGLKFWEFWVTCGVKMMSLCPIWGWHTPQTTSYIHIRHIQSIGAIGMLSQVRNGASIPLHWLSWPQIWEFWVTIVEWEWCHYVMVEPDIHLRPYHTSIFDMCTVFEPLVCCLKGNGCIHMPLHQGSWPQLGIQVYMWSENYAITSNLRLISTLDPFCFGLCKFLCSMLLFSRIIAFWHGCLALLCSWWTTNLLTWLFGSLMQLVYHRWLFGGSSSLMPCWRISLVCAFPCLVPLFLETPVPQ